FRGFDFVSALWRGQTCRERLRLPASLAGSSKSCLPLSSFRGARSGLPCVPACRAGRIGCSSGSPVVPTTRPIISRFRPIAWSRSVPRSPCDFGDRRNDFATYWLLANSADVRIGSGSVLWQCRFNVRFAPKRTRLYEYTPQRQKFLNRWGASSVYLTVC